MSIRSTSVIVIMAKILFLVTVVQAQTFTGISPSSSHTTYHKHPVTFTVRGSGLPSGEKWLSTEWYVDGWHAGTSSMSGREDEASWTRVFDEQGEYTVSARGEFTSSALVGDNYTGYVYWTISVNSCEPIVSRVSPDYQVTVEVGSDVTFIAEARDTGADLKRPSWSLDGQEDYTGMAYIGDGENVEISAFYTFDTPGTYDFTISAYDWHDFSDSTNWSVTVLSAANQPPVADIGGPYAGDIGQTLQFDGSGSSDPDGNIVSYVWDFGDGNVGSGANTTHTYDAGGVYTVTLTVTDDDGSSDAQTTTAHIASEASGVLLSVSSSSGGMVNSPGEGTFEYDHGDVVILEAVPESGYTFTNWSGSLWDTGNPLTLTMTSSQQVKANFEAESDEEPDDTPSGLLAHWTLDEGSGRVAQDAWSYGHHGTLVGPVQWSQGPEGFGGAAYFNGSGHIEVDDEPAFDLTDAMTVAGWVYIERIPMHWTGIITKGDSSWRLSTFENQPRFHFAVTSPAVGANWVNGLVAVGFNQWYHVAGTFDGEQIRLYIDGIEDTSSPVAYSGRIGTNNYPVWIADNAEIPGHGLKGRIDDIRIYDYALTQDEILALMGGFRLNHSLMQVREVIDNGSINDQNDCYAWLDAGTGTVVEYTTPVLNIWDSGSTGHFGQDAPFAVVAQNLRLPYMVDDLCLEAVGTIRIPDDQAGLWTFGVNSDDGFTLQITDHDFISAINGEIVPLQGGAVLRFHGGRPIAETLGTVDLPAGDHRFWLTYHEGYGDASVEFYAARGSHTAFDPDAFHLVGSQYLPVVPTNPTDDDDPFLDNLMLNPSFEVHTNGRYDPDGWGLWGSSWEYAGDSSQEWWQNCDIAKTGCWSCRLRAGSNDYALADSPRIETVQGRQYYAGAWIKDLRPDNRSSSVAPKFKIEFFNSRTGGSPDHKQTYVVDLPRFFDDQWHWVQVEIIASGTHPWVKVLPLVENRSNDGSESDYLYDDIYFGQLSP